MLLCEHGGAGVLCASAAAENAREAARANADNADDQNMTAPRFSAPRCDGQPRYA
jgi:hypothetical protein